MGYGLSVPTPPTPSELPIPVVTPQGGTRGTVGGRTNVNRPVPDLAEGDDHEAVCEVPRGEAEKLIQKRERIDMPHL